MQIKYNRKRDILLIDFADNISELEKDKYKAKSISIISLDNIEKTRGFVIAGVSERLPEGFWEKIEKIWAIKIAVVTTKADSYLLNAVGISLLHRC